MSRSGSGSKKYTDLAGFIIHVYCRPDLFNRITLADHESSSFLPAVSYFSIRNLLSRPLLVSSIPRTYRAPKSMSKRYTSAAKLNNIAM